jgi:hypothetical protein
MAREKASEDTGVLLESIVNYDSEKKKMFGYQVYFVNNNMFTGVFASAIFLRL